MGQSTWGFYLNKVDKLPFCYNDCNNDMG